MHPQPLLAVALGLAILFAGCAGDRTPASAASGSTNEGPPGFGPESGTVPTGQSASKTATGTAADGDNRPPSVTFAASIQKGSAPLNVTFTIGGNDPDGKKLSYALSFGDASAPMQNKSLPPGFTSKVLHQYVVGLYNATIVVSDGDLEARTFLLINATVTEAGPNAPTVEWTCLVDVGTDGSPVGLGFSGGGKNVGPCTFGTTETDMTLHSHEVPAGCHAYDPNADVTDGATYASGTVLKMNCGAGTNNAQGTLRLR